MGKAKPGWDGVRRPGYSAGQMEGGEALDKDMAERQGGHGNRQPMSWGGAGMGESGGGVGIGGDGKSSECLKCVPWK